LSVATAVILFLIASGAVNTALEVTQEIQSGRVQPDIASITASVTQHLDRSEYSMNNLSLAFGALWLIGIFDSYRIGRSIDKPKSQSDKHNSLRKQGRREQR